jgi:signal transduction histidine kinase
VDHLLNELVERWRVVADRDWQIETATGVQKVNADRLRACVDTLVENAVRYTSAGDVIRVFGRARHDTYVLGVADSGPGLTADQVDAINAPSVELTVTPLVSDPRSQSGLGLSLVRDAVEWRGGRLVAGRSREGGAELRVMCPRHSVELPALLGRASTRTPEAIAPVALATNG